MNWKFGLMALGCSLCVLNPLDAARQLDQVVHNPRTVADASSMLQQMHGEMRLIQEQLGSLKASQQLMGTENAIKSLTPKVRKLEVHLERLEKKLDSLASFNDVSQLKNDLSDLKLKVQVLVNAPDISVESALSALSPTLERMQKQVYFLYEAVKTQSAKQEKNLNERLNQVAQKVAQFASSIQDQLSQAQSMSSSVNLIRQALVQNHMMIKTMKVDMESLKNEKLGAIDQQLSALKVQVNKDELVAHITVMKDQIQRLASVFKKTISSVEQSFQKAEQSIETGLKLEEKINHISLTQGQCFKGLKALYKKEEGLKEQLKVVHSVLEQNMVTKQKLDKLVTQFPLQKMLQAVSFLKGKTDLALDQIGHLREYQDSLKDQLNEVTQLTSITHLQKKQINSLHLRTQALKKQSDHIVLKNSDMETRLTGCFDAVNQSLPVLNLQKKQINVLYQKTKSLVSQKDLEVFKEVQCIEDKKIDSLSRTVADQNQKLVQIFQKVQESVKQQDFNDLVQSVSLERSKIDYLNLDLLSCQDKVNEMTQVALQLRHDLIKTESLNEQLLNQASNIAHLQKQTIYLHQQMRQVQPVLQLEDLKQGFSELATKVKALDETFMASDYHAVMDAKIHSLTQKLEEKDEAINKLSRKVAFLMRTLKEKMDQAPVSNTSDLGQLKAQIEEKIDKELKAVQNDRLAFETLIQRIAALEATLSLDEISESSD